MKPLRILIIENEPDIATLIRVTLEDGLGATMQCVATEAAALDALARTSPKLAIIDIMLAGPTGFSVAQCAIDQGVPVLLISGHPDQLQICAKYGLPHLAKPFPLKALASAVVEIIAAPQQNLDRVEEALALLSGNRMRGSR